MHFLSSYYTFCAVRSLFGSQFLWWVCISLPLNEARDPLMIYEHDVPVMNRGAHPKLLMENPPVLKVILPLKKHHQMKAHQFQTLT